MMTRRLAIFICFFLPISLFAQEAWNIVNLSYQDENGKTLTYDMRYYEELQYTTNSGEDGVKFKVSDFRDRKFPLITPGFTILRLTFELTPNSRQLHEGRRQFVEVKVANNNNSQYIDLGRGQRRQTLTFVLRGRDTENIRLKFIGTKRRKSISDYTRIFDSNQKTISHKAILLPPLTSNCPNSLSEKQIYISESERAYEKFKILLPHTNIANYASLQIITNNIKQGVNDCYDDIMSQPNSPERAVNLYKVFASSGFELTREKHQQAKSMLEQANREYFDRYSNQTNCTELRNSYNRFERLFNGIPGYRCLKCLEFESIVDDCRGETPPPPPPPPLPCEEIRLRYENSTTGLRSLLQQCREKQCEATFCREIEDKIAATNCREALAYAKNRNHSPEERRAKLQQLINNEKCTSVKESARSYLTTIPELKIDQSKDEGIQNERDPATGLIKHFYKVHFQSGKNIKIDSIGGIAAFKLQGKWEWLVKDSTVSIQVDDPEKEYQVIFSSENTGERVKTVLTKEKFHAIVDDTQKGLVLITLKNGSPPYYARFAKGTVSFTQRVNSTDTINLNKLAENNGLNGSYALTIIDNTGKVGNKKEIVDLVTKGFKWSLWMFLVGPLVLLTGFMMYRNLSVE